MIMTAADNPAVQVKVARKNWRFVKNSIARRNLLVGGAGSSKSYTVAQHLILNHFCKDKNIGILVCCKTLPSVRVSALALILKLLKQYNIPYDINKSDLKITGRNGAWMLFRSLDNPEKLKSIEGVNLVWVEEATEITIDDYLQLNIRCRHDLPNVRNQLYFTFNPVDFGSFLRGISEAPPDDTGVCHTTYKDNPFLPPDERAVIENLINEDEAYYQVYALGKWRALKGVIYDKWDVVPIRSWPPQFEQERLGLDFGYSGSETALIHIRRNARELWLRQLVFEKKLTTPALIERMRELHVGSEIKIIADCERPDDIDEILYAGFNIHPCKKGPGSVKTGIDRVRRFTQHVLDDSPDIEREIKGYKWKVDKNGDALGKPVAFKDHAMDSIRYGASDMEMPAFDYEGATGTPSQMQAEENRRKTVSFDGAQEMIDDLSHATHEEMIGICQSLMRNPTPAVVEALQRNLGHENPEVARRCDEMCEALRARGRM